jgi:4-diphosphocytidyl-2-C-methyl-D-erythritol kinase
VRLRALAPAKVNLCLFLGGLRADGRHELVTLFESISLADELELSTHSEGEDEVSCPGVEGPNLISATLAALRDRGWSAPPVRIRILKRVPVAGGMGGGSADAAAALRLAGEIAPLPGEVIAELAPSLGADVPSQLAPGLMLGTGAGDLVKSAPPPPAHAFLILPQPVGLFTPEVYREAERMGLPRRAEDLARRLAELREVLDAGALLPAELLVNDLEPAALSLRPEIEEALDAAREAEADHVMVCGSGPTVAGLYWGQDAESRAARAGHTLRPRFAKAAGAVPVTAEFGLPLVA